MNYTNLSFQEEITASRRKFIIKNGALVIYDPLRDYAAQNIFMLNDIDPEYHIEKKATLYSYVLLLKTLFVIVPVSALAYIISKTALRISGIFWPFFVPMFIVVIVFDIGLLTLALRNFFANATVFMGKNKISLFEIYRPFYVKKWIEYYDFIDAIIKEIGGKPIDRPREIQPRKTIKQRKHRKWDYP